MHNRNNTIVYLIPLLFAVIFVSIVRNTFANATNQDKNETVYRGSKSISEYLGDRLMANTIGMVKQAQKDYTNSFDFQSDSSLQKYITKDEPLTSDYKPLDLEKIESEYVTMGSTNDFFIRMPARIAFQNMAKAFYDSFGEKLYLVSAYRSYTDQLKLLKEGCSIHICAEAGLSEHQLGLAVDIHIDDEKGGYLSMKKESDYYQWLNDNAYKFGYHNTYQENNIEKKMAEPRHRAYKGKALAKFLHDSGMTIGEYYGKMERLKMATEGSPAQLEKMENDG